MSDITLLEQRRIEARIVAPLVEAFAAEVGRERALQIIAEVIARLAREAGSACAQAFGGTGTAELMQTVERWRAGGALELDVIRHDDEALDFDVTRCRFAEMYREMGLDELGAVLSCNRDGALVDGFNPQIELTRTQTILSGADCCNFRFRKRQ